MYFTDLLDDRFSTYRDVDTFFIWVAQQNTSIWFISYTPFTNGVEWKIPPPINQGYPPALPTLLYKLRPWLLSKLLACCQVHYFARPNSFLTGVRKGAKNSPSNTTLRNPISNSFLIRVRKKQNSPEEFSLKHSSRLERTIKKHLKLKKLSLAIAVM